MSRGSRGAIVLLVAASVLGLAACGGSSDAPQDAGDAEATAETLPVPTALISTESAAEDIVDLALGGDLEGARARADELAASATGAAADALASAGVPTGEIDELAARAEDVADAAPEATAVDLSLAANAVSGVMPALFEHFSGTTGASVLELDYLDREIQLNSLALHDDRVRDAADRLESTWNALRPAILSAGGEDVAGRFDAHVASLGELLGSGDRDAVEAEAVTGLVLVDELEGVLAG